jgi:hypothetical protein
MSHLHHSHCAAGRVVPLASDNFFKKKKKKKEIHFLRKSQTVDLWRDDARERHLEILAVPVLSLFYPRAPVNIAESALETDLEIAPFARQALPDLELFRARPAAVWRRHDKITKLQNKNFKKKYKTFFC